MTIGDVVGTPRRIRPKSRDLTWHQARVVGFERQRNIRGRSLFTVICEPLCGEPPIRVRNDDLERRQQRPLTDRDWLHEACWDG